MGWEHNAVVETPPVASRAQCDREYLKTLLSTAQAGAVPRWVWKRWLADQNVIGSFIGPTGAGKSNNALVLAMKIDPDFGVDQVIFHVKDFIPLVESLGKYKPIVIDEAAIEFDSRKFQRETNEVMRYLLQTQRYKNQAYFFTFPSLRFIDVSAKLLFHFIAKCKRPGWADVSKYEIETDLASNRTIARKKRFHNAEGDPIECFTFPKVPAKLWREYERKKDEFNMDLRSQLQQRFAKLENKEVHSKVHSEIVAANTQVTHGEGSFRPPLTPLAPLSFDSEKIQYDSNGDPLCTPEQKEELFAYMNQRLKEEDY